MYITSMTQPAAPIVHRGRWCALPLIEAHRTALAPAVNMGSTSVFGTGNPGVFGPNAVNTDARVRDAKPAAPPRGELC